MFIKIKKLFLNRYRSYSIAVQANFEKFRSTTLLVTKAVRWRGAADWIRTSTAHDQFSLPSNSSVLLDLPSTSNDLLTLPSPPCILLVRPSTALDPLPLPSTPLAQSTPLSTPRAVVDPTFSAHSWMYHPSIERSLDSNSVAILIPSSVYGPTTPTDKPTKLPGTTTKLNKLSAENSESHNIFDKSFKFRL